MSIRGIVGNSLETLALNVIALALNVVIIRQKCL